MVIRPLTPHPALMLEGDETVLVVADVHLGFELELMESGINIPSQTRRLAEAVGELVETHGPDRLLILGDLKHNVPTVSLQERMDVPEFLDQISRMVPVEVVVGNHDGMLDTLTPPTVTVSPSKGVMLKDGDEAVAFFHGHSWPDPKLLSADVMVMAHIHPTVAFKTRFGFRLFERVWVKCVCDGEALARGYLEYRGTKPGADPKKTFREKFGVSVGDPRLIVMPAFNESLGGAPVNGRVDKQLSPVLRSNAVRVDGCEVYLLDGTYLGDVRHLRALVR